MGAQVSCPQGFQQGFGLTCHYTCPDKFKYAQEDHVESCVSQYTNDIKVQLKSLPYPRQTSPEPAIYTEERTRMQAALKTATEQALSQQPVTDAIQDARGQMAANAQAYSQIRTEYAKYSEHFTSVKDVVDGLKPLRPPTAPASDLAAERKGILESSAPNFLLIQVELAIVILCLLAYIFLPLDYAPGIVVLLLSVGAALGIFLRK